MNPDAQEIIPVEKNDQQQKVVEQEAAPQIKTEENQANWRAFREQREAERKAKEDSDKRASEKAAEAEALRAALEALTNKPQRSYQNDIEETEEQRIDKRVKQIIDEREAQAKREWAEREQKELPVRLKTVYSDFNNVCSSENIDYLEFHHPVLAKALSKQQDGFDKWSDIYNAIKKYVPNIDSKIDKARAEKNLQKPGSISSPGTTQGTGIMPSAKLDEARKSANWERMQRTIKGLS